MYRDLNNAQRKGIKEKVWGIWIRLWLYLWRKFAWAMEEADIYK